MSKTTEPKTSEKGVKMTRRSALGGLSVGAATVALTTGTAQATPGRGHGRPGHNPSQPIFGGNPVARAAEAFTRTVKAARARLTGHPAPQATNGDETLYLDYRANFSKTLPHDSRGIVDRGAYRSLLRALESGKAADFENIQLDSTVRTSKLANPMAAYAFGSTGADGHSTRITAAPAYASLETASEMLELYWKALCRDIPFADYETNNRISRAVADMNAFPFVIGNAPSGGHTPMTVFRGETPGDRTGPHLSQFLWHQVPFGNGSIVQRYGAPARGTNFMADIPSWLTVQRGGVVGSATNGPARFLHDARGLAEYVHSDFSYQAFLNAALILLGMGRAVLDPRNPGLTSRTGGTFVTLGGAEVLDMVARAAHIGLRGAWYQKWLVHRRLRPEMHGGRLQFQFADGVDDTNPAILKDTRGLGLTFNQQGNYLLSQCFPEGSPTHPAFPAGHACIAGACVTILKAYFNDDALIPNPVESDRTGQTLLPYAGSLTVGGELNKLANNIALGRDWAGVHYRSDGIQGLALGEQIALDLLKEHSAVYAEVFDGYQLTLFDGRRVTIRNGHLI